VAQRICLGRNSQIPGFFRGLCGLELDGGFYVDAALSEVSRTNSASTRRVVG
jgi:hypothetical protein